ncbi:hypothetical protein ABZV93_25640 [Actinopolymorpha sp. NPDC004070]|uniref:site-specific integrase n=1 Tax=Actinopolymorpha sp. NPDC004070 TaxID=3154548 RepID=UPI0033AAB387
MLGDVAVPELRPMGVREWVAQMSRSGLSPSRVGQAYRLPAQILKTAQLDGLVAASPCVGVQLPRLPEHEPTILKPVQVADLAGAMPGPYDLFVLALAYTGCRFGELTALQWRYVDLASGCITVASSLSDANGVLTFEEPNARPCNQDGRPMRRPG